MYRSLFALILCILCSACEIRVREVDNPIRFRRDSLGTRTFQRSTTPIDSPAVAFTQPPTQNAPLTAQAGPSAANMYDIITPLGVMRVRLYDETPMHRDNFKSLVAQRYYDGTTFHRVIRNFMIQGGDPNSRDSNPFNDGTGGPGYTVPAEINPGFFHKRGALAAARQADAFNPQRSSNGSQFFIVQGQPVPLEAIPEMEQYLASAIPSPNFRFSQNARNVYTTAGGYPMLDRQYTVFGELISGFDVLDRISATTTDTNDRPVENITMTIRPVVAQ